MLAIAFWLQNPGLFPSTPIEGAVFALALLRGALYLGVPRLRRMNPSNVVVLLSGDVMVLPVAIALYLLTGDYAFDSFGGQYLASWLSAALLVYPPIAAYAVAGGMKRRSRLAVVAPGAAGIFALSTSVMVRIGGTAGGQGLSSVARWTLGVQNGQPQMEPGVSLVVLGCSALLFVSLVSYSVAGGPGGRLVPQLAVGVVGVAVALGWEWLVPGVQLWLAYGVPAAAMVGLAWVLAREG